MSDKARVVSSREVHHGRVVHLFVDTITLPNGHTTALEVIKHPGAAAVVPFLDADTILLVRQYRHAAGGYLLEIPAGKLDAGEAPEACAARETEEETGHRAGRLEKLGAILTTPGFTDEIIHLYAGYDLAPTTAALEADEDLTVLTMPFADALAMVERGEITDAKTMSALLLAARARERTRA
jgi:ADP-ribose pyrophosphatase